MRLKTPLQCYSNTDLVYIFSILVVVMETIRPAHLSANTESTQIKSKIPEYARDYKNEWLFIRGINKTCGEFVKRLDFGGDLFNSSPANRIKYFIKKNF